MLKRKIIIVVSTMAANLGISSAAVAQSEAGFYGSLPCGFFEVKRNMEPGPAWRIDFKKWESAGCISERRVYEIDLDPHQEQRAARRQKIKNELVAAEQTRGRMESARLAAEAAHAEVSEGLREAERLYRMESEQPVGNQDWTVYKAQSRAVEGLRRAFRKHNADYLSVRREYETKLASLKALQVVEVAS